MSVGDAVAVSVGDGMAVPVGAAVAVSIGDGVGDGVGEAVGEAEGTVTGGVTGGAVGAGVERMTVNFPPGLSANRPCSKFTAVPPTTVWTPLVGYPRAASMSAVIAFSQALGR